MKTAVLVTFFTVVGYFAAEGIGSKIPQREYTILITRTPPPAQIIGRIQVGLTKAEAEGAAFQLNELFTKEKLEWKAVAAVQTDVSTLKAEK